MTSQQADIGQFLDQLHEQLSLRHCRTCLPQTPHGRGRGKNVRRLETEGRAEQKQRTRELETKLAQLLEDFESQLKESVRAIEDKTVSQKIARDSALRMSRLRREFSQSSFRPPSSRTTPVLIKMITALQEA